MTNSITRAECIAVSDLLQSAAIVFKAAAALPGEDEGDMYRDYARRCEAFRSRASIGNEAAVVPAFSAQNASEARWLIDRAAREHLDVTASSEAIARRNMVSGAAPFARIILDRAAMISE